MKLFKITGVVMAGHILLSLLFAVGCVDEGDTARTESDQATTPTTTTTPGTAMAIEADNRLEAAKRSQAEAAESLGVAVNTTLTLGTGVTLKLVLVPAGTFTMGSPATERGRWKEEGPQREVTISTSFHMGMYEVTRAQWKAVMTTMPWGKHHVNATDNNPANCIGWNDAVAFCEALSKKTGKTVRLPTEAEWEYACRAGTTTAFCFGDDPSRLSAFGWRCDDRSVPTRVEGYPVGGKKPNAWGLYDMHGNVSEWCNDWWTAESSYANANVRDPKGLSVGTYRICRGGSVFTVWQFCRSAFRGVGNPNEGLSVQGFRVVVEAGPVRK